MRLSQRLPLPSALGFPPAPGQPPAETLTSRVVDVGRWGGRSGQAWLGAGQPEAGWPGQQSSSRPHIAEHAHR